MSVTPRRNGVVRRDASVTPRRARAAAASGLEPEQFDQVLEEVDEAPAEPGPASAAALAPMASGPVRDPDRITAFGANGELLEMVKGGDGVFRTVSSSVPEAPISYQQDHPLLQSLRSRTKPVKSVPMRAPAYNCPPLWYMKTDGTIVQGQGDPGNRAYYEDKGFVVLRPEEVNTYLRDQVRRVRLPDGTVRREVVQLAVRKLVMKEQARRATLVTTIRNIARRNPSVEIAGDLAYTPTEELEQLLEQLKSHQSINFTLLQARQPSQEPPDDEDVLEEGMELASGEDLYRKMEEARGQGYLSRSGGGVRATE